MVKAAVILSGCGHADGAEIRESVITLLELDKANVDVQCFAPDMPQAHVVNHLTGEEESGASRNVLTESARIARGDVKPLSELAMQDFDILALPGGFGAAKNLSRLAFDGASATVLPEYKRAAKDCVAMGKPIIAICISPAVLVAALKENYAPRVTIGEDGDGLIASLGGEHEPRQTNEAAFDASLKIASASAYMRGDAKLKDVAEGIAKAVEKAIIWAQSHA